MAASTPRKHITAEHVRPLLTTSRKVGSRSVAADLEPSREGTSRIASTSAAGTRDARTTRSLRDRPARASARRTVPPRTGADDDLIGPRGGSASPCAPAEATPPIAAQNWFGNRNSTAEQRRGPPANAHIAFRSCPLPRAEVGQRVGVVDGIARRLGLTAVYSVATWRGSSRSLDLVASLRDKRCPGPGNYTNGDYGIECRSQPGVAHRVVT